MAYPARGRDPLLDSDTAAAVEKRGRELFGIVLVLLGLAIGAMVLSYAAEDPSWMSATDAPVQNWMGRLGAAIAAPVMMIVGYASWGFAAVALVWGLRFALHQGSERIVGRIVFAPIVIALAAIYAATLVPGAGWSHSFGLGGLFGDTVLGALLTGLPVGAALTTKLASFLMAVLVLVTGVFVLGFTMPELRRIGRFLMVGLILAYATLMNVLGRSATGAVSTARALQAKQVQRREARAQERAEAATWEANQLAAEAAAQKAAPIAPAAPQADAGFVAEPAPQAKPSILSMVPSLIRRPEQAMPEPELVEQPTFAGDADMPSDDRIRAKIAGAIKDRVRRAPVPGQQNAKIETVAPLTKGRGRGPQPLVLDTSQPVSQSVGLPPEPPLSAGAALPPEPPLTAPMTAPLTASVPVMDVPVEAAVAPAAEVDVDHQVHDAVWDAPSMDVPAADAAAVPPAAPMEARVTTPAPKKVVQQPTRKPVQPSSRAKAEAQPSFSFDDTKADYDLPPLALLSDPATVERHHLSDEALEENARMLESVLDDYGVKGEIVSVRPGPVVTMYELEPAPGLKASRVIGLSDDIARSMSALSARVSTVPGRSVIGIELPNDKREMVSFREILSTRDYGDGNQKLPLALGKDIGGDPVVANLAKMPHLLIAGTTGSGKSVAINTMILSLLYKLTPEDLRMVMIDPKMLELSVYDGIPHLLSPVVTDPKKAVVALKWVVGEMEERYRKMSKMGVRNIDGYNSRVADALAKQEMFSRTVQTGFDDETGEPVFETEEFAPEKMPYIVVIVDEMADLMMVAGKEIEACIQRLAQMARASGIHLIMATQRPSVDVITGTIKANFPTRISFQVTSKIDSRTILGEMGAEQLLGMGDMLYMAGGAKITRCHGPFVSDEEVEEIVNHLKAFGPPEYVGGVVEGPDEDKESDIDLVLGLGGNTDGEDALYDQAVAIVIRDRKCSTSYIQRKLAIGYNKAARLVEQMEDQGVVSAANHVGKREILVPEQ
ncbi:DNA translocase FtsK [Primorskyibacter sp. S187A]|uniref:DNA translocase FtsK n=1 Tax=Primorskyibacter sp. S187A TaxID=3415130 RepID=UPI003C7E7D2C